MSFYSNSLYGTIFHKHFLTSSLLLSCSSSRFIFYMRSNKDTEHWRFSLKVMVKWKNNQIKKFKICTMFSERRLANSVFSRITMSFLMESRWPMSCWTAISLQWQTSCLWARWSSQCIGILERKSCLPGGLWLPYLYKQYPCWLWSA